MIALHNCSAAPRRLPIIGLVLVVLLVFIARAVETPSFYIFGSTNVQPGNNPQHANNRHDGEKFPPGTIRACIAGMASPFQYENGNKIAFLCQLARNRWGIQIVDAASRCEITSFYGTLARLKNVLTRDGYTAVVPLP